MGLAFAAAALGAALVLAVRGTGERGTVDALLLTGRISFLLFWPAYAGSALASLFGPAFQPLKRGAPTFGLAFAAAQTVHAALVARLCWIGATPARGVFVLFGPALLCMYLLALGSLAPVRRALGRIGWRVLQYGGMNYIAYVFAVDFLRLPQHGGRAALLAYLPFAALSLAGPALVAAQLALRAAQSGSLMLPARRPH